MTIQQFIEKAIEGGWKISNRHLAKVDAKWLSEHYSSGNAEMFLDPEAWKAVGKVEGWNIEVCKDYETYHAADRTNCAICNMHRMIDALAEGKTIEQFLETL